MGEDVNSMLIVNLLSGTDYNVKVMATYSSGASEALSGRAKTSKSSVCRPDRACPSVKLFPPSRRTEHCVDRRVFVCIGWFVVVINSSSSELVLEKL